MCLNPKRRIAEIDNRLQELPKGTLTYKKINGKSQPYVQRTVEGKSVSYYVKLSEREQVFLEFQERTELLEEREHLLVYVESLKKILSRNPYLDANVGLGYQNFLDFVCGKRFYVDKTHFIPEWLANDARITLITRPRRFGKSMLLSTVRTFFDPMYADHPEYFEKLRVWKDADSRSLFGTIPVISVSFGSCKGNDFAQAMRGVTLGLYNMYIQHEYLRESPKLSEEEKAEYRRIVAYFSEQRTEYVEISIQKLCELLYKHYGKFPIILMDEYDTPLLEAYTDGYWDETINTFRQLFHTTFKENDFFYRAIITGVTRISKNSLFSDLNNLEVDTVTCDAYSDCFGFTEQEVMDAFKCQDIDTIQDVKAMYDGFTIGRHQDIYNPWSICNYMRQRELIGYWVNTSSNKLVGDIIRRYPVESKYEIERLMAGEKVHKRINEGITFQYLEGDENSLWSLLLAVGYIKAENIVRSVEGIECDVSVTNREVMAMFKTEILGMFHNGWSAYGRFAESLLAHKMELMNEYLQTITYTSISYFDVADGPKERTPENFYHGLVLGLIVSLRDRYRIVSNRESGRGRYDIAMYPLQENTDAFIMEFKVQDRKKETDLEQTAKNALQQIVDKNYEADLLAAGVPAERIYKLGFAFAGKDVLVVSNQK